jgi:hypothetical protein
MLNLLDGESPGYFGFQFYVDYGYLGNNPGFSSL